MPENTEHRNQTIADGYAALDLYAADRPRNAVGDLVSGGYIKTRPDGPPSNYSTRLMDLLQDAYDAGADPDLSFDDFIRHALAARTLTIEVTGA